MVNALRILGVLLILIGIGGTVWSRFNHLTSLIPAVLGALLVGLGVMAGRPGMLQPAMGIAMMVSVFGIMLASPGVARLPRLVRGMDVELPKAVVAASATSACLAAVLVVGIGWLIWNR